MKKLTVLTLLFSFVLAGCQIPSINQTNPSVSTQEQPTSQEATLTKKDLSDFLLNSENAYCDLKKVDFIFWQKYNAPKYQQIYIQPGGNDVPLMRWLGNDGLNYLSINNTQSDFDKITNSPLQSNFSESVRLTNLSFSFLKKYLTTDSTLESFAQFRDEAGPSLSGFRDTIPKIEPQLRDEYASFIAAHPDLVAPEDEGSLAIDSICTTLMPELTQSELQGVPYTEDSQSLTKIDLDLWQPPKTEETAFIKVTQQKSYPRASNKAININGTTSDSCSSIEVDALNTDAGVNDKYVLTNYKKGDTTFKYGVREDWNNLGPGKNEYTFIATCDGGQTVQDLLVMELPVVQQTTNTTTDNQLSNDNYYTNSANQQIHSPAYSNTAPAGASAQCGDGTYSFSTSRSGTCSHHGGVASWL